MEEHSRSVRFDMEKKGIALKSIARVYDLCVPTEKGRFRQKQINLVALRRGERVLDVGCGTGSLCILAKKQVGEDGKVVGVDLSSEMVKQARKKAQKYNLDIHLTEGSIDRLEFPNDYFDVAISTWMFHHLPVEVKKAGLKEIYRVLKRGGRFLFSDFSKPHYLVGYIIVPFFIWTDFLRAHILGKIPPYFKEAGFKKVTLKRKGFFTEAYLMYK